MCNMQGVYLGVFGSTKIPVKENLICEMQVPKWGKTTHGKTLVWNNFSNVYISEQAM